MNYLIIGLGNFGLALATRLTAMGHDVFAVDSDMKVVEDYKNSITTTIQVQITDQASLSALPVDDADEVIVTLGEDIGASILVVSLLRKAGVKRLVARAINPIHKTILETIGVDDVIMPEVYAADLWAVASESEDIKGVYLVSDTHQIIEFEIPTILEGLSLTEANIEQNFLVKIVAIKRQRQTVNFLGAKSKTYAVIEPESDFRFIHADRIILYGAVKDFAKFRKQYR